MKGILAVVIATLACLALSDDIIESHPDIKLIPFNLQEGCYRVIRNKTSGRIMTPNFPVFIPLNSSCTYIITSAEGSMITLTWQDFYLPPKVDGECEAFALVFDGTTANVNQYPSTPLCGRHDRLTIDFTSSSNQLSIIVSSDTSHPDVLKYMGFMAYFHQVSYQCDNVLYETAYGAIASPHFPLAYPPHQDCVYQINVLRGMSILLDFAQFALKNPLSPDNGTAMENCDDYVEVYEGSIHPRRRYFKRCGFYKPPRILTGGNIAYIKFHSSKSALPLYTGFRAFYSAGFPDKCGFHDGTAYGTVSVPVTTVTDGKDVECQFVVKSKEVAYFKIRWLSFGISMFEGGCDDNYIEIYDGLYNDTDKLLIKKCDKKLTEINTQNNEMLIRYKIKDFQPSKNFELMYIGVTDNTVKVITDKNETCTKKTTIVYRYSGPEVLSVIVTCIPFTIGGLPLWASVLVVIGCCIAGITILVGGYCVIRRRRLNRSYGRLSRTGSDRSI